MASSERRIRANRINAQKSSGPKTDEGKEIARGNAYKHGMTAVVVMPDEDRGEAARRTDALQKQMAPAGDELGMILARHVALLSMQVERCAAHERAMTEERVRTAEADRIDARRAEAEHLFTYIGAEGPTNHRRLLTMPEGIDLIIEQIEALEHVARPGGAGWSTSHSWTFDHLTGKRFGTPVSRMTALGQLIERDDASGLPPAEVQGSEPHSRRVWAAAEVVKLIAAELARLRTLRADLDRQTPPATPAANRATVGSDKAVLLTRKYQFAAFRAMIRAIQEVRIHRRDERRHTDPVAKAALRARVTDEEPSTRSLPAFMASFFPAATEPDQPTNASTSATANTADSPPSGDPNASPTARYTP